MMTTLLTGSSTRVVIFKIMLMVLMITTCGCISMLRMMISERLIERKECTLGSKRRGFEDNDALRSRKAQSENTSHRIF